MIRVLVLVLLFVVGCSAGTDQPRGPVVLRVSVDEPSPQRVEVAKGQDVEITVTSREHAEVHVHGFDVLGAAEDGKPAVLKFVADRTGTFEVEAHQDTLLAQLVVR